MNLTDSSTPFFLNASFSLFVASLFDDVFKTSLELFVFFRIFDQVKMRGKEYEEKINLEYLEKICSAYSEFFFSYSESPLLVLNVDDVDFVSNQMDFNQIIDCVKKNIIGREFINLSPSFF